MTGGNGEQKADPSAPHGESVLLASTRECRVHWIKKIFSQIAGYANVYLLNE